LNSKSRQTRPKRTEERWKKLALELKNARKTLKSTRTARRSSKSRRKSARRPLRNLGLKKKTRKPRKPSTPLELTAPVLAAKKAPLTNV
jgi:septal ring factor EnvC (AmiA/AmiB activator)